MEGNAQLMTVWGKSFGSLWLVQCQTMVAMLLWGDTVCPGLCWLIAKRERLARFCSGNC